jgi:hypothetical protein
MHPRAQCSVLSAHKQGKPMLFVTNGRLQTAHHCTNPLGPCSSPNPCDLCTVPCHLCRPWPMAYHLHLQHQSRGPEVPRHSEGDHSSELAASRFCDGSLKLVHGNSSELHRCGVWCQPHFAKPTADVTMKHFRAVLGMRIFPFKSGRLTKTAALPRPPTPRPNCNLPSLGRLASSHTHVLQSSIV